MLSTIDPWNKIKFFSLGDLMLPLEDNEIRLLLSNDDEVKVIYDGKNIELNQGDFLILNAKSNRSIVQKNGAILISLFIDSDDQMAVRGNKISTRIEGCSSIEHTDQDDQMITGLTNLIKIRLHPHDYTEADILKEYYGIISLVYRFYVVDDVKEDEIVKQIGDSARKAFDVKKYIDIHYRKPITLDFVADNFYLSSPYLSRLFKKIFNQSFHKYITHLRIQSAINDMMNTNNTLTDIALDNGFPNVGSFNIAFKKDYGKTPGIYRRQNKDRLEQERAARDFVEPKQQMDQLLKFTNTRHKQETKIEFSNIFANKDQQQIIQQSWRKLINLGSAESLLSSGMEQQIKRVQSDIHFEYGRLTALFTDTMLMVNDPEQKKYSFTRIDEVLSMLLRHGLIPFVELGKKPLTVILNFSERLKSENPYQFISKESFNWQVFLTTFIRHCIAKWGKTEVSKWQFELWYPSKTVMTSSYIPKQDYRNVQNYLKQFAVTNSCIKKLLPDAKVGGCGLSVDLDFHSTEFILNNWKQSELPDFFSIYIYPQNFEVETTELNVKNSVSSNPDKMANMIDNVKKIMQAQGLEQIPLYVTEWNISISDRNFVHDSLFKSAYILRNILHCANKVDVIGYWQLSDSFGTFSDINGILHGGSGLLTKDNIKKPAYYAFQLLNDFTGELLANKENITITAQGYDRLNVLVSNYKHFNSIYYLNKENTVSPENINKIFENTTPYKGVVSIEGMTSGRYLLKEWLLDNKAGDVLSTWIDWGEITDLGSEEVEYLKRNIAPQLRVKNVTVTNELILPFNLVANAVCLFELYKEP